MRYVHALLPTMCAFFSMCAIGGVFYNFGTLYTLILENMSIDPTVVPFIGTLSDIIFCSLCPYGTLLTQRYGFVNSLLFGAFTMSFGLFVSSFIHEIYFWFFTYSIVLGIGFAVAYMSVVEMIYTLVPRESRSFAMGFSSGGMFIGYSIFAPLLLELESSIGLWSAIVTICLLFEYVETFFHN